MSSEHQHQHQKQEQTQKKEAHTNDAETEAETTSHYDRDEEYRLAQQAASEAVMIGRETLAMAVRQGEQLENAETMADDTDYTLDKANRLLRGMTWSGWLANKFSKEVDSPGYKTRNGNGSGDSAGESILGPPRVYERIPEPCRDAAQAVQNYHLNLQVLEHCETEEQRGTCRLICDNMHKQARLRITEVLTGAAAGSSDAAFGGGTSGDTGVLADDDQTESFALRLQEEAQKLRERQLVLQHRPQEQEGATGTTGDDRTELFRGSAGGSSTAKLLSFTDKISVQQDNHLNTMAQRLQELGSLAGNLNISLQQQSEVLDSLDSKNDTLQFKANAMNRRTERFLKDKSWGQQKPDFLHYATIQHKASGRYLSVAPNNNSTVVLSGVLNERCVFGIYQKKRVLGLQNKFSRRWVGQNLLGQLACSASAFQRREEWEAEGGDWSDTTLLVVSAGWGTGGYLLLDGEGGGTLPIIGGGDMPTKNRAPKWCIREFDRTRNA